MRIDVLTIFPGMFKEVLDTSIIKRAREKRKLSVRVHDLRLYSADKHRKVDDRPFGGGAGMVISAEPVFRAVNRLFPRRSASRKPKIILLCPQGRRLTQEVAKKLSASDHLLLVCGHYEGIDERVRTHLSDDEISIGDYVLTGGELPAMVLIDCLARLIPGVLGDKNSLKFESFEGNLLEYPHYTRPADFRGMKVPPVLLSGNHREIAAWRHAQSLQRTVRKRPDLLSHRTEKKSCSPLNCAKRKEVGKWTRCK
jgi:tRNA (guanine37-N1)-methyltransferase